MSSSFWDLRQKLLCRLPKERKERKRWGGIHSTFSFSCVLSCRVSLSSFISYSYLHARNLGHSRFILQLSPKCLHVDNFLLLTQISLPLKVWLVLLCQPHPSSHTILHNCNPWADNLWIHITHRLQRDLKYLNKTRSQMSQGSRYLTLLIFHGKEFQLWLCTELHLLVACMYVLYM